MKDYYTGYERPSRLKRYWMMFYHWIIGNFKK